MSKLKAPIKFSELHENRFPPRHIITQFQNTGNRGACPSTQREKAGHSQMIRREDSFRSETGSNTSKFWENSHFQPRILYPVKNPAKNLVKCVWRNKDIIRLIKPKILTPCILQGTKNALCHQKRSKQTNEKEYLRYRK